MQKVIQVLQSRKFWALIGSLVAIYVGFHSGAISPDHAVELAVAALGAYSVGTGLDQGS